jgi:hypothetical protein
MVVMLKVALVAPAATVTLAGTVAIELLLVRVTTAPPAGAVPPRVIVPVEEVPPVTLAALRDIEARDIGVAVKVATLALPALTVTVALAGVNV